MVGTKFLVQWEEHPSHMATRLGYLLENQILVDVTLMCNTHTLKVHKVVLASCSPYFEGVLQKQLGTHPLIVLKDMKFSVLRSLIEFMYCGETSIAEDNLTALLDAAKFFEVKGLATMKRDSVSQPAITPTGTTVSGNVLLNGHGQHSSMTSTNSISSTTSTLSSNSNDNSSTSILGNLAITSNFNRGTTTGRKVSGRGRRSSFINSDPATSILNSGNDPASILLSLSGSKPNNQQISSSSASKIKMSPGGGRFSSTVTSATKPFLGNGSLGVGEGLNLNQQEPRRRGRRKLTETSIIESKDKSGDLVKLNKTSSSLSNSIEKSPLLASLLANEQAKKKGVAGIVTDPRYFELLKKASGISQDPVFYENGNGDIVTLTDNTFLTVLNTTGEPTEEGEVTEAVVMQDGTICTTEGNQIAVEPKFVQSPKKCTASTSSSIASPTEIPIKTVIEKFKGTDAPSDPNAVVLFEVNEQDSNKLDKYVISSEEVQALKLLNQLVKEKNLSKGEISKMIMSTDETNTQIAEINLMLGGKGKCKSIIKKILEMGNGLKGTLEKLVANKIPNTNLNNNNNCTGHQNNINNNHTQQNDQLSIDQEHTSSSMSSNIIQDPSNESTVTNSSNVIDGEVVENAAEQYLITPTTISTNVTTNDINTDGFLVENNNHDENVFKHMMTDCEDNYVSSVDTDKVDDEFKLHNEEDSHSSHSFSSSQHKIILSNVLMNSGEDMNILAHMDTHGHKELELLDDDCSQEEYLKSTPYSVDEFITAKRKSTDDDINSSASLKKVKFDEYSDELSTHQSNEFNSHQTNEFNSHQTNQFNSHQTSEFNSHQTNEFNSHQTNEFNSHQTNEFNSHQPSEFNSHQTNEFNSHHEDESNEFQIKVENTNGLNINNGVNVKLDLDALNDCSVEES